MIKRIVSGNDLIAIIIPHGFHKEGVEFFTPPDLSQQLGYMKHPKGHKIATHTHNLVIREVKYTLETLLVRSGKIRINLHSREREYVASETLVAGDIILLVSGGHGIAFLEESELIEIKQGPYLNYEADKKRFKEPDDKK